MKKRLSSVFVLFIVMALLAQPVFAADTASAPTAAVSAGTQASEFISLADEDDSPLVYLDSAQGSVGDLITVTLSLGHVAGFTNGSFIIQYNPYMLQYEGFQLSTQMFAANVSYVVTDETGANVKDENGVIAHDVRIGNRHLDPLAEIVVPFDMRRNADGNEDIADALVQRTRALAFELFAHGFGRLFGDFRHPLLDDRRRNGLDEIVPGAERNGAVDDLIVGEVAEHDEVRLVPRLFRPLHDGEAVERRQKQARHHHAGRALFKQRKPLSAVARHTADLVSRPRKVRGKLLRKRFVAFQNEYLFHPPFLQKPLVSAL